MFGFNLRSLAEAAINTITGGSQTDEEIAKLMREAEKQDCSFGNLTAMTKELEKQLVSFADTNGDILKHIENLNEEGGKKGVSFDIWGRASRFYYCIGVIKEQLYPDVNDKIQDITSEIARRSESLHDLRSRASVFNKKQSSIVDDEDLLKQLRSREEVIASHGDAHSDMVSQTKEQIQKLSDSIEADKKSQQTERESILAALNELISGNKTFVEESVTKLSDLFSHVYLFMSQCFSAEIPADIMALQDPLFPDQVDKVFRLNISAGSIHSHPISVTKGSQVKWSFCCDDSSVRFGVTFTETNSEVRTLEEAHRVKGDGRFDIGEVTCDAAGVLTLVWDNTYSLITSREVVLRVAVKHPKAAEEVMEEAVEDTAPVDAKVDAKVEVPAESAPEVVPEVAPAPEAISETIPEATPTEPEATPEATEQPPVTEPETAPDNTQTEEPATNDQPVIEATEENTPVAPVHKKKD
ncbi:hypothetical protein WA588_001050 [Blastocystis sp. NMH]